MQWAVNQSADPESTIQSARDPGIRLFTVPRQATGTPLTEVKASWQQLSPDTVKDFTAVGYAFGKALRAARKVPVGLISTNYGGTPAEAWTRKAIIEQDFPSIITSQRLASMPMTNPNAAGGLYNAMIAPLIPYAIRGAIWYQGESNAGRAWEYRTLFPAMIRNWREDWGQGDFPFLFVQLAPFMAIEQTPKESAWAELREAQLLTLTSSKNTGMAVITDLGDEKDIHPKRKREVGERLALAARKLAYGENITYRGPEFRSITVRGSKAVVDFNYADGGLHANGPLTGFAITGEDGKWVNADAEIHRKSVVVSSPQVKRPVAVRFGWANYPVVNLTNGAGLPASPFRTDTYPVTTQPK
jgi:sialate O-acetylesterase